MEMNVMLLLLFASAMMQYWTNLYYDDKCLLAVNKV